MIAKWMLAAAPLFAAFPSSLQAQASTPAPAVTAEQMMRHIKVLASDEYEGRKPGTAGENKTLYYIASQFAAIGLEPAGTEGWYQPVGLVERKPASARVSWTWNGKPIDLDASDFILVGKEASESLSDAPAYFVGHGLVMPEAGIDQLAGLDLNGAVVFLWSGAPQGVENAPRYGERVEALVARGAAGVIGILSDDVPWRNAAAQSRGGSTRLQIDPVPQIGGSVPSKVISRLLQGSVEPDVDLKAFRPVRLDARATLDVTTSVRAYDSHNVIGRLRGTGKTGEHVLYLGHWDHLGICRPDSATDKICNGAVDNASGIAMMIEIARNIAHGKRPERDLLFMGTTAEEMGLLGAEYFGAKPVVSAQSIVAAINIDTVAIAGKGEPVAIVGRGTTGLDGLVDETTRELGRPIDPDDEANAFVQRQDGWALTKAGVPTVMVGGSFANMAKLMAFLGGPYHKPDDDLNRPIELEGAAEDTNLLIALGRKLADPKRYQPKRN
jgi:hypothetical protein